MASLKATLRNLTGRSTSGDTSHVGLGVSGSASGRMISPVGSDLGAGGGNGSIEGTARRDSPSIVGVLGKSES